MGTFVTDRRPGLGEVPGRIGCVSDRAEFVRAVLGRAWGGELSSVITSCEPELRRRCGFSPRGDSGPDMVKERMRQVCTRSCPEVAIAVQRARSSGKRVLLLAACAACNWNAQEGNDVRSAAAGGCQGQQQHQIAQSKPRGAQCVTQAEGGTLLGIAAGEEQKKGRCEERKWRCRWSIAPG